MSSSSTGDTHDQAERLRALRDALVDVLGPTHVLVADARDAGGADVGHAANNADALDRHLIDWRKRYHGRALAVVRPADAEQVAAVIKLCGRFGASIVPQGGNTSLVGGSVPDASGLQIVLSLSRLRRIIAVDKANLSITVEAGCMLADVQSAAAQAGLLFPLSLASEGSCTIGGNLATNAGGTQVLRYGTARELCLGIEAVTAQGEIWHGLQGLRKDNTGYDLRDLLIGSEGTLGVITAATLRLYPRPKGQATALLACPDMAAAVSVLQRARDALDAGLTAYEVMAQLPLQLVQKHHPDVASVMSALCTGVDQSLPAWAVLIDHSSNESDAHAQHRLQALLHQAMEDGLIVNATLASNATQRKAMWHLRETIPLSERTEGLMVKHDIGVPTSAMTPFVALTEQAILARWPQARIVCFGHLGDGNLHYNVQPPPEQQAGEALLAFELAVNELVFDQVQRFEGTLSAEHGIGALRRDELARRKSPVAMSMMRAIKQALDPVGILNPGRVL